MDKKKGINKKINDLEQWLIDNPSHPDYSIVLKDKTELKRKLLTHV